MVRGSSEYHSADNSLGQLSFIMMISLAVIALCCAVSTTDGCSAADNGDAFDFTLNVYYSGTIDDDEFTITGVYLKETGSMLYDKDLVLCEWVKRANSGSRFTPVTADYDGIKYHVVTFGDGTNPVKGSFTSITFSDSIEKINNNAFNGSDVSDFDITGNITEIGDYAFANCDEMTIFIIPDNVETVGKYCFSECDKLEVVTISKNLSKISQYMFYSCPLLKAVVLEDTVTEIGDYAFCNCNGLTSISLPDTITSFGIGIFSSCGSLIEVNIPKSIMTLSERTFFGCSSLEKITIFDNITTVGTAAFQNCWSLSYVELSENLLELGSYSFAGCTALKSIHFPETLKKLSDYAFYCSGLESISLPDSISSAGEYVFSKCSELKTIAIGQDAVAYLTTFEGMTFLGKNGVKMQNLSSNSYYIYDKDVSSYRLTDDIVKICWLNNSNTGSTVKYYTYIMTGTVPEYDGPEMVRNTDTGYSYTFSGWTPSVSVVTANTTYTATFLAMPRSYTITWMNGDEVYSTSVCDYGTKIIAPTPNPTKPSTETTTYQFSRWNGYIDGLNVEGDTTFYAEYKEIKTVEDREAQEKQRTMDTIFIAIGAAACLLALLLIIRLLKRR